MPSPRVHDALFELVFGAGDPTEHLVDHGKLPDGWAEEYTRLLGLAEHEWSKKPLWPRSLATAIYWVSTHLEVRYLAWQASGGAMQRNEQTERELASVCFHSRVFFVQWLSSSRAADQEPNLPTEYRDA